jgi:hypothetical protein
MLAAIPIPVDILLNAIVGTAAAPEVAIACGVAKAQIFAKLLEINILPIPIALSAIIAAF